MKLTIPMALAAALAASMAWAGAVVPGRTVIACSQNGVDVFTQERAQVRASNILATAGVRLEWRAPRRCPDDAIRISLSEITPESEQPGALAYAMPYEGTHIVVFYGRIQSNCNGDPTLKSIVLAHVLAHEIAHILQAMSRHSESGIMKAHWDGEDFSRMRFKPLAFTEVDVYLIQRGLDARSGHEGALMAGISSPAAD
jgi:hypothetical protein